MLSVISLRYLLLYIILFAWCSDVVSLEKCSYVDSVNVTSGTQLSNGSVLFEDLMLPPELLMTYTHKKFFLDESVPVEPYMRGCICHLKPCINFCCPWGSKYQIESRKCQPTPQNITWPEKILNVSTVIDGGFTEREMQLEDIYHIQYFRPCEVMFVYDFKVNYYDEWRLLDDGDVFLVVPKIRLTREQYCFSINYDDEDILALNPVVCDITPDFTVAKHVAASAFLISIFFMLPTIFIYLWLPELRNCMGLSLVCYLSGLIFGYAILAYHDFFEPDTEGIFCQILGYICYYGFISAFFWLNAISFDVYCGFRSKRLAIENHARQRRRRFIVYSIYCWGMSVVMLIGTWYAQEYSSLDERYKPGIGGGHFCWIDFRGWAGMIYLHGPLLVLTAINIFFFSSVAIKIYIIQKEINKFTGNAESTTTNLSGARDNFFVFFRLFLIMGVTWSLEIISYLVGSQNLWSKLFYVIDLCNALQGLLIFLLFVMKKQVRSSIKKRLCASEKMESINTLNTICEATPTGTCTSYHSSTTTLSSNI